jgi:hypothetical protein
VTIGTGVAPGTAGNPARTYATRSETCRAEMTWPQTGMYGAFGFADSPRPWLMIVVSCSTVSCDAEPLSAGTAGETPPLPFRP